MNWCEPHWLQLRQAIKDRGLDALGAQDAESALSAVAAQIEGEEEAFDPLIGSWARLNAYMAESLIKQGRQGELLRLACPCCILVEDLQPHLVANWIDGVTDAARQYALEKGLIHAN